MMTDGVIISRLVLSSLLGGLIGLERETHNKKTAGFRTHILVCVGATLIMLIAIYLLEQYSSSSNINIDPGRLAVGVITGIGFLGAGTIIRSGPSIVGLTTAASLWVDAGIGLAIGCGFYTAGYVSTIIVVVTLYLLRKFKL